MKTDKLIKFLQENYQPGEELCWQTWCRADFIETGVNEVAWKIAVDKFSEYESEDRTVIKDCIFDAQPEQSDLILNDEPTIERVEHEVLINGVVITGDNPDADYDIVEREDKINDLLEWIAEASPSDKDLMRVDLEMLIGLSDEWILSDVGTNSYLALSTEREDFIQQCNTLVDLYKTPVIKRVNQVININGIEITGDNPDADHHIIERLKKINDLTNWIAEADGNDVQMLENLKMLLSWSDEWILSDSVSCGYVSLSSNREMFIRECDTLVDLYKTKPVAGSDETPSDA